MEKWSRSSTTSERLKQAMRLANMKQADLARRTGLSKGGISNYVMGRYEPKSDIISRLAEALNCSEMWLWGYDVPMERQKKPSYEKQELSEGEKVLLDLFNKVPDDKKDLVLQMIRVALENQK